MSERPAPGPAACRTSRLQSPHLAPRAAECIPPWASGALYKHDRARPGRTRLMRLRRLRADRASGLGAACVAGTGFARAEPRDFIHADGARLVDGRGNQFDVKGINLGNWLVPEGYMFKFKHALSPMEIARAVRRSAGAPRRRPSFWTQVSRRLHRQGRHRFHQKGRLQHRSRAARLAALCRIGR